MVQLRRPKKEDGPQQSLVFVGGLVLGGLLMYIILSVSESSSPPPPNPSELLTLANLQKKEESKGQSLSIRRENILQQEDRGLQLLQKEKKDVEDGWHPINVFYGKRSGLGANLAQSSFSQVNQDRVVLDLIGKDGFFIDLAANDALDLTNTLLLEQHGWKGLCVEPNPTYWYGLSHRKCTVVGALVGGHNVERVDVKFRGVYGGIVGKMDKKMADFKREPDAVTEKRFTAPFGEILQRFDVPKVIDYVSLDVEGAEFLVMQNFPFDTYRVRLMTIERPTNDLKTLLAKHGYIQLKELVWWGETLWAHESEGLTPDSPKIKAIPVERKN